MSERHTRGVLEHSPNWPARAMAAHAIVGRAIVGRACKGGGGAEMAPHELSSNWRGLAGIGASLRQIENVGNKTGIDGASGVV